MKYAEVKQGRVFVLRLEDREEIQPSIEQFAVEKNIKCASIIVVGGIDEGTKLIVGPKDGRSEKIHPIEWPVYEMHEVAGTGTIFPDKDGKPKLHLHIACGRKGSTLTGDVRKGAIVWHILEVIIYELLDCKSKRLLEKTSGFELLNP